MPLPEPFSLSARDAVSAIALVRRVGFLTTVDTTVRPGGTDGYEGYPRNTVPVRTAWAIPLEIDETFPLGHQRRFDLVVNGDRILWDRTFIEYDGRVLLLKQLYTYRNQRPVPWGIIGRVEQ